MMFTEFLLLCVCLLLRPLLAANEQQPLVEAVLMANATGACNTTPYVQTEGGSGGLFTGHYYAPVVIPCPRKNNGVIYEFSFSPGKSSVYMMAVSHAGMDPTLGISMWKIEESNSHYHHEEMEMMCTDVRETKTGAVLGVVNNKFCGQYAENLQSKEKLCSVGQDNGVEEDPIAMDDDERIVEENGEEPSDSWDDPHDDSHTHKAFAIFNDGGCEGYLTLEAAIRDLESEQEIPVQCVTGPADVCKSAAMSSLPIPTGLLGLILSSLLVVGVF